MAASHSEQPAVLINFSVGRAVIIISRESSQHFALRFADSHSAARYPLPVSGPATYLHRNGGLIARLSLPAIPPDWIIAASFVTPGRLTPPHQFRLLTSAHTWPLLPVPSTVGQRPDQVATQGDVSTHIDCWHSHRPLTAPLVELQLDCAALPDHHLLCVSARPLTLTPTVPADTKVSARTPLAISQMMAKDTAIRHHICSPTSVAMLMPAGDREVMVEACRDSATGLFGSWPMAVRAAAMAGHAVAGVELHADWSQALYVLRQGYAFATSIRYPAGKLAGAPLNGTSGHLVIVHGVDGNRVLVHDPAAENDTTVSRTYDAQEFSNAWLAIRGASYIIAP